MTIWGIGVVDRVDEPVLLDIIVVVDDEDRDVVVVIVVVVIVVVVDGGGDVDGENPIAYLFIFIRLM